MNLINTLFGIPLGFILYLCYRISGNSYALAIFLFTILTKIIMFPLSILVQKNSIKMVQMLPHLSEIKKRYAGDKDHIADEQIKLYEKENYHASMGLIPTLIQIPMILGLINVIYNPLQHLLHFSNETINTLLATVTSAMGGVDLKSGAQLKVVEFFQRTENLPFLQSLQLPTFDHIMQSIKTLDMNFLGLNLSVTPSLFPPNAELLIPLLSGLSALLMCVIQNRINILQRTQSSASKWGMTIFLVAFSTYFPFIVPAGVGLYWVFSNLTSILVSVAVNLVYDPKKHVDLAAFDAINPRLSNEEKQQLKEEKQHNNSRQRDDIKKFYGEHLGKQLVFYSEHSGYYKYFENIIDYVLTNSDIPVHYVTSDPNDAIFQKNHPRIIPYFVSETALISFMMKMDAAMVVMTMPDLQQYHIKKSMVRKDIEYIYVPHTVASIHMTLREGALDHYNTIFCVGPHQFKEIRKTEQIYGLSNKKLVKCGYGLIDNLLKAYQVSPVKANNDKPQILIAPSWQEKNIMETCLDDLLQPLVDSGQFRVIVRPHPEYVKRFDDHMAQLIERWQDHLGENLMIETDFSSNDTISQSDLLITDWSNIAFEYSFCSGRPTLFINTPMKVMNPDYSRIEMEPLDISLREKIGQTLALDQLDLLLKVVTEMIAHKETYTEKITQVFHDTVYYPGHSGAAGGHYIIKALAEKL